MTTTAPHRDRTNAAVRRTSLTVLIAAWLVPVFVLGQFAFLAGLPIAVVVIGTLRDTRLRALGWWTGALTAAYAVPMAVWLIGPSTAPSLSKFLSPVATGAVVAVGVAVAVAHHIGRRRSGVRG
ncbi:hypothetical protein [Amycolatopsis saalfeldensis]|uniref:Uncharacterized protein n=1 Tax=Amycolatopsis saalfeldensis TaxID=394193 RepID=A0A1H8PZ14_9PSEU|nr:hypothetical protein [Amycolatopsis saalfeldensis]SEO47180.1 hypothetical protein SAMN04489732_101137 [Amycolatopsis saalfeldensis]